MPIDTRPKDPKRVAAGRAAMMKRWDGGRIVRLDKLDPITVRAIRAIVAAAESAPSEMQ